MTEDRADAPQEDRLEQLEDDIREARDHLDEQVGTDEERRFIDSGEEDTEGPVDDTIAPPG